MLYFGMAGEIKSGPLTVPCYNVNLLRGVVAVDSMIVIGGSFEDAARVALKQNHIDVALGKYSEDRAKSKRTFSAGPWSVSVKEVRDPISLVPRVADGDD